MGSGNLGLWFVAIVLFVIGSVMLYYRKKSYPKGSISFVREYFTAFVVGITVAFAFYLMEHVNDLGQETTLGLGAVLIGIGFVLSIIINYTPLKKR